MNIKITINTDNDALDHNCKLHGVDCGVKFNTVAMRKILQNLIDDSSSYWWHEVGERAILDENGNTVGKLEVSENET